MTAAKSTSTRAKKAPAKKAAAKSTKPVKKAAPRSRSGSTRRKAIGSGRAGAIRKALAAAVLDARNREGVKFSLEDELRVLLAEKHAALVDDAVAAGDAAAMVRASDKLLEVLDTLPVRVSGGGDAGDGSGKRGTLLRLMDGPPQVGDTAHS